MEINLLPLSESLADQAFFQAHGARGGTRHKMYATFMASPWPRGQRSTCIKHRDTRTRKNTSARRRFTSSLSSGISPACEYLPGHVMFAPT